MSRILLSLLFFFAIGSAASAQSTPFARPGKEYFPVATSGQALPASPQVIEFFSYGCVHCAEYQPEVEELIARMPSNASLRLVPVIFNPQWEPYSRAFFAAQTLGVLQQTHRPLFTALHQQHAGLLTLNDLAGQFYKRYGVLPERFLAVANSADVSRQLDEAYRLAVAYGVDRTPTLAINGKYRVIVDETHGVTPARTVDLALELLGK